MTHLEKYVVKSAATFTLQSNHLVRSKPMVFFITNIFIMGVIAAPCHHDAPMKNFTRNVM